MIVLGAAYQAGAIPVSAAAIEQAIALNGVAVAMNTHAFRAGRLLVADPAWLPTHKRRRMGAVETPRRRSPRRRAALVERVGADGELRRLLEIRVPELIAYQDARLRPRVRRLRRSRVRAAEQPACRARHGLSEAVARYLFKLMAYKDEYEVARLHLKSGPAPAAWPRSIPGGVRGAVPPAPAAAARARLEEEDRASGAWFDGAFRLLVRSMKGLRGTALDPFGRAERAPRRARADRRVPGADRAGAGRALARHVRARGASSARLPDVIRGYEDIKLRNVDEVPRGSPPARRGSSRLRGSSAHRARGVGSHSHASSARPHRRDAGAGSQATLTGSALAGATRCGSHGPSESHRRPDASASA